MQSRQYIQESWEDAKERWHLLSFCGTDVVPRYVDVEHAIVDEYSGEYWSDFIV